MLAGVIGFFFYPEGGGWRELPALREQTGVFCPQECGRVLLHLFGKVDAVFLLQGPFLLLLCTKDQAV